MESSVVLLKYNTTCTFPLIGYSIPVVHKHSFVKHLVLLYFLMYALMFLRSFYLLLSELLFDLFM